MSSVYRLEEGSCWKNPWTEQCCQVVSLQEGKVKVKFLGKEEEYRVYANTSVFMELYVALEKENDF